MSQNMSQNRNNGLVSLMFPNFAFEMVSIHYFLLLTRWLPAYGIFVLRFRPEKQQFSVALPTP